MVDRMSNLQEPLDSSIPVNTQQQPTFSYGEEQQDLQYDDLRQQVPSLETKDKLTDEELKKKIALYYHPLFQGCLGQWFVLMQGSNYSHLTKRQYLELNIRIQKSLILDFELSSAQQSALEDWEIDIDREALDTNQANPAQQSSQQLATANEDEHTASNQDKEPNQIDYEKLSEFFFDLCLSWCQYLDIETFLFFLNGVFLNITQGSHVNVSTFKEVEEVEVLSVEFFNQLLNYRTQFEEVDITKETYRQWYNRNFQNTSDAIKSVEENLLGAFKDKDETRILDLWIELPSQKQNEYINQHFQKIDYDMKTMNKAIKATGMLTQSITMMDHIKQFSTNAKGQSFQNKNAITRQQEEEPIQQYNPTVYSQNNTQLTGEKEYKKGPLKINNTKLLKQDEFQRQLLGQLSSRFQNGKLLEVSENSYLITTDVRLPVFGKQFELTERTKSSISKRGYLLKMHQEYTNPNQRFLLDQNTLQLSSEEALQTNIRAVNQPAGINQKNVVYEKIGASAPPLSQRQEDIKKQTTESQSNLDFVQQPHIDSYEEEDNFRDEDFKNISVKVPDLIRNPLLAQNEAQPVRQQEESLDNLKHPSKSPNLVDEKALNLVYDRYLEILQEDKNAKLEDVLKEERFVRQFSSGLDEQELEEALMEKFKNEDESNKIQDMIAKFYSKFDQLHEKSAMQALAKSPNKAQIKNEVKYKIPERWTKKFNKFDILPVDLYKKTAVNEERGKINKSITIEMNKKIQQALQLKQQQRQQQVIPLSNTLLKENLSSRTSPKSEDGINKSMQRRQKISSAVSAQREQQQQIFQTQAPVIKEQSNAQDQNPGFAGLENIDESTHKKDELEQSTDVSKAGDFSRQGSEAKSRVKCVPQKYDWSDVIHLFEDGVIPEELQNITDPVEYNYLLIRLKKDFNDQTKSEYLKYMNLQLPYHSRRDEIGGRINKEEWEGFVERLEGIIDKVKRKRRRIIKRRKKRGNKKLPRKTLFKPNQRPDLSKNPLWREVFLDKSSEGESDEENDPRLDSSDLFSLGVPNSGFGTQKGKPANPAGARAASSNKTVKQRPKNLDLSSEELSLPPIMRPLMSNDLKNQGRVKSTTGKLRNAEMNLKETIDRYPNSRTMLNIKFKDQYHDPFIKEPHYPARRIAPDSAMVQRIEHSYTKKVRSSLKKLNNSHI